MYVFIWEKNINKKRASTQLATSKWDFARSMCIHTYLICIYYRIILPLHSYWNLSEPVLRSRTAYYCDDGREPNVRTATITTYLDTIIAILLPGNNNESLIGAYVYISERRK